MNQPAGLCFLRRAMIQTSIYLYSSRSVTRGAVGYNAPGAEKNQKCRKYFLQYSTFAPERPIGSNPVAPNLFLVPGSIQPQYAPVYKELLCTKPRRLSWINLQIFYRLGNQFHVALRILSPNWFVSKYISSKKSYLRCHWFSNQCCSGLHRLELLRQAQEKDGNSGH